jgi:hypothetical protein
MIGDRPRRRMSHRLTARFALRPGLEQLEDRFLLYATTGTQWPQPSRITYSFMPDGTSIGGVPSNLQQTLNAKFTTANWQAQFARATAAWEKIANVNFSVVSDNGAPLGVSGNLQSDTRFGDIRIGGYAMAGNILAFAYLPPPANGGTSAGDIFLNTSVSWQIDATTYDLMTVAIHEFGHSLGMNHSAISTAAMWPSYTGAKEALTADDTAGIRTIYNARQKDSFDAKASNDLPSEADVITSYIGSNGQLTLSSLDSTTPTTIGSNDIDWYQLTVPTSTTGTMVVKMQATNLSLLAPSLAVYNSAGTTILGHASSNVWGDTVTVTINNVTAGQIFDIKCMGSTAGDSGFGAYGLQVNLGSQSQAAITPPTTTMPQQPDQGGGTLQESSAGSSTGNGTQRDGSAMTGVTTFWGYADKGTVANQNTAAVVGSNDGTSDPNDPESDPLSNSTLPFDGVQINLGNVSGIGDALMTDADGEASLANQGFGGVMPWTPVLQLTRTIAVAQTPFGPGPVSRGFITSLDFAFGTDTSDNLTDTTGTVSATEVDTKQSRIAIQAVSTSGAGLDDKSHVTALDFSAGDDRFVLVGPSLLNAKDRFVELLPSEAVDILIDCWEPDLFE